MKKLEQKRERYMRDELAIRLGGIAANLARVRSASRSPMNRDLVFSLFEESKFFIEWTAAEASLETAEELVQLQIQIAVWQRSLGSIWDDEKARDEIGSKSMTWSNRLIERSGLLER